MRWDDRKANEAAAFADCPQWIRDQAVAYYGEADFLVELDDLKAPPCARSLVRYFNSQCCERFFRPGVFQSIRTMAKNSGIPVRTIRRGLDWLVDHGFLIIDRVALPGGTSRRKVDMKWCLWLLPSSPGGTILANAKPPSSTHSPAPISASPSRAESGRSGAPFLAAENRSRTELELRTTTSAGESSSFSIEEEKPEATRAESPTPIATPIPAAIAATLVAELPQPADQGELAAIVPTWIETGFPVEWIVWVILEAVAARQARASSAYPVHSLAGFADGILGQWRRQGKPTLRHSKPKLPPSGKTPEMAKEQAKVEALARERKRRLEDDEAARLEAERKALEAQWQGLPEIKRNAIMNEVQKANPRLRGTSSTLQFMYYDAMIKGI